METSEEASSREEVEDQAVILLSPDLRHPRQVEALGFLLFAVLVELLYLAASFVFAFHDFAWPGSP